MTDTEARDLCETAFAGAHLGACLLLEGVKTSIEWDALSECQREHARYCLRIMAGGCEALGNAVLELRRALQGET